MRRLGLASSVLAAALSLTAPVGASPGLPSPTGPGWAGTERAGMRWSIQPTPRSDGPGWNVLSGVSCLTPTNCYAVGNQATVAGTLAEHWDGSTWSIMSTPSDDMY